MCGVIVDHHLHLLALPPPPRPPTDANRKRLSPEVFSVLLTAMHRKPDPEREEDAELLW
jgi:hypothetical protein